MDRYPTAGFGPKKSTRPNPSSRNSRCEGPYCGLSPSSRMIRPDSVIRLQARSVQVFRDMPSMTTTSKWPGIVSMTDVYGSSVGAENSSPRLSTSSRVAFAGNVRRTTSTHFALCSMEWTCAVRSASQVVELTEPNSSTRWSRFNARSSQCDAEYVHQGIGRRLSPTELPRWTDGCHPSDLSVAKSNNVAFSSRGVRGRPYLNRVTASAAFSMTRLRWVRRDGGSGKPIGGVNLNSPHRARLTWLPFGPS